MSNTHTKATQREALANASEVDDPSIKLSSIRTGMSYQRTRLSADRTLMSVIRTSLSLIGFGFTIFQVFSSLQSMTEVALPANAPRNLGVTLVAIGIAMLALGIFYHLMFMKAIRDDREDAIHSGLVRGKSPYPISMTLLTAAALLFIGILVISSMVFGLTPFG